MNTENLVKKLVSSLDTCSGVISFCEKGLAFPLVQGNQQFLWLDFESKANSNQSIGWHLALLVEVSAKAGFLETLCDSKLI
jgi:hypothetical protein